MNPNLHEKMCCISSNLRQDADAIKAAPAALRDKPSAKRWQDAISVPGAYCWLPQARLGGRWRTPHRNAWSRTTGAGNSRYQIRPQQQARSPAYRCMEAGHPMPDELLYRPHRLYWI